MPLTPNDAEGRPIEWTIKRVRPNGVTLWRARTAPGYDPRNDEPRRNDQADSHHASGAP